MKKKKKKTKIPVVDLNNLIVHGFSTPTDRLNKFQYLLLFWKNL